MSDLLEDQYFSFSGEKTVYHVFKVSYHGNYNGGLTVHYVNIKSKSKFTWHSGLFDSSIIIHPN